MQSRIGYICMLFLNVSSTCLPKQMQSRIGCICTLFHQGSFQMFSKIACLNRWKVTNGCTCTFFSTVSSNCLPKKIQSRIGCICTLLYAFFNCLLKLSARTDAKSHWLHLYAFSPSHKWLHLYAFFNCLLKLSARKDAKSHWLHFYTFSPEKVFKCFLKSHAWTDGKSH